MSGGDEDAARIVESNRVPKQAPASAPGAVATTSAAHVLEVYRYQVQLFEHYSNKVFATRFALITATVGAAAYVLGIWVPPGATAPAQPIVGPCASALLGAFWLVEMGYFKKYNRLLRACALLEQKELDLPSTTFFRSYTLFTHRWVYSLYLMASISLLCLRGNGIAWCSVDDLLWSGRAVLALPTLLAVGSTLTAANEWGHADTASDPARPWWSRLWNGLSTRTGELTSGGRILWAAPTVEQALTKSTTRAPDSSNSDPGRVSSTP